MKHISPDQFVEELAQVRGLQAARAIIAKGWCQGDLGHDGSYCAVGAFLKANADKQAFHYLKQAVGMNIVKWNDMPWRTQDHVLDAYSRAIELAKQNGGTP